MILVRRYRGKRSRVSFFLKKNFLSDRLPGEMITRMYINYYSPYPYLMCVCIVPYTNQTGEHRIIVGDSTNSVAG